MIPSMPKGGGYASYLPLEAFDDTSFEERFVQPVPPSVMCCEA